MPLVGDQAAALTSVEVGLRMDWQNTHSEGNSPYYGCPRLVSDQREPPAHFLFFEKSVVI
jgi:hypothetical protein